MRLRGGGMGVKCGKRVLNVPKQEKREEIKGNGGCCREREEC